MSQIERIYKIDRLLRRRKPPSRQELLDALEVSPATLKRDLEFMRSRLNAPIEWDREARGYRYGNPSPDAPEYSLPGLWFTAAELSALLLMHEILEELHAGLLRDYLAPLENRVRELLERMPAPVQEVRRRFRILHAGVRPVEPEWFQLVSQATLARRKLWMNYYSRARDAVGERVVSPQRLISYRSNWYLQAWCHERRALRSFALDSIRQAKILAEPAIEVAQETLDASLGVGYGIFAGPATEKALLRFSPQAARWVSRELWHPDQRQSRMPDGTLLLEVPYSSDREILMDVLRHGPDVQVLAPDSLRRAVAMALERASALYRAPRRMPARALGAGARSERVSTR
ncbi:MAG: WYL domain-containing protein [Bryobacterales bacterium]|nr:WYL domain-containing protein [Bryobacteraceae bacterium]MDW8355319.1 WYL domain-containing protein [Bryobacterales bacterium]